MSKAKRLWALLLTLAMVLTYMPTMAFANGDDEGEGESVSNATIAWDESNPDFIYSDDNEGEDFCFEVSNLTDESINYSVIIYNSDSDNIELDTGCWEALDGEDGVRVVGSQIWAEAEANGLEPTDNAYDIIVEATIEKDGYEIDDAKAWIDLKEARTEAHYEGNEIELIYDEFGEHNLSTEGSATVYSKQYPDGEELTLTANQFRSNDSSVVRVGKNEDGEFCLYTEGLGETTLIVTMTDEFGNEYTDEVKVSVTRFSVEIDSESGAREFLPNSSEKLKTTIEADDVPSGLKYKWTVQTETDETKDVVKIANDPSESNAAILSFGNLPDDYDSLPFDVMLEILDSNNKVVAKAESSYRVSNIIYILSVEGDTELMPGEAGTITCTLLMKDSDNPDGIAVDGAIFKCEGFEDFTIKDLGNGQFSLTRESEEMASVDVYAYLVEGESYVADKIIYFESVDADIEIPDLDNNTLYSDGNLTIKASSPNLEDEGYSVDFEVYINKNQENYDFDENFISVPDNGEFFTVEGDTLTLKGEKLVSEAAKYEDAAIFVKAVLKYKGKEIANSEWTRVYASEPIINYIDPYELQPRLLDDPLYIDKNGRGVVQNAANPDETYFDYEVISVEKANSGDDRFVIKAPEDDEDGWTVIPKEAGTFEIVFKHKDYEGDKVITETLELSFVEERAEVTIVDENLITKGTGSLDTNLLPTETEKLYADGKYEKTKRVIEDGEEYFERENITKGLSYTWSFVDTGTSENEYAVLENPNTSNATLRIKKLTEDVLGNNPEFAVKVIMNYGAGSVESEPVEFKISKYKYRIEPNYLDYRIIPKVKTKIDPKAYRYEYENGKISKTYAGNTFEFDYDTSELSIVDSKSKEVVDRGHVKGPFYVTRKTPEWTTVDITFETDDYWCGDMMSFRELKDISKNNKVTGITNRTYSSKAQTQKIKVSLKEDDWWYTLPASCYKIAYKNNKNVGLATVTITGQNEYYGSITKTFKINPKGTSLKKVTKGKKSFTATWKKQATQTTGYQIQYGLKKNFKGAKTYTVNNKNTVKTTIRKLKAKKTYYVRIRTYKTVGKTKYVSGWSKAKKIKTK